MTPLELLYSQTLQVGFVVLRQAVDSGSQDWINAELELLHNVPSLMGEGNKERHRYFWQKERTRYLDWVSGPGRDEARSRMRTYYEPIWDEMGPLVEQLLGQEGGPGASGGRSLATPRGRTTLIEEPTDPTRRPS